MTALHRAAFLAEHSGGAPPAGQGTAPGLAAPPILLTTFTRNLAESLDAQLALLIQDPAVYSHIEVLNLDRLAYSIVKRDRGTPGIAG